MSQTKTQEAHAKALEELRAAREDLRRAKDRIARGNHAERTAAWVVIMDDEVDAESKPWNSLYKWEGKWTMRIGGDITVAARELPWLARCLGERVTIEEVNGGKLIADAYDTPEAVLKRLHETGGPDLLRGRGEA